MVPLPKVGAMQSWLALDPCLAPLTAESAHQCPVGDMVIDEGRVVAGASTLVLRDLSGPGALPRTLPNADAAYQAATTAYAAGDIDIAQQGFCEVLGDSGLRAAALYGLACCQASRKAFVQVLDIVRVLNAAGVDHPVFSALGGQAAAAMNDTSLTRHHLARAARGARGEPALRDILRFAQRTLLIQQFGN